MKLVGNALNGSYFPDLVSDADTPALTEIHLAMAYVRDMDAIFELATKRDVPLRLFALVNEDGFPSTEVVRRFVSSGRVRWQLFLTRDFYHPKIARFVGVGAYIGSANLTQKAWWQNLECGIWLDEAELVQQGWDEELDNMFGVIRGRSREAVKADIDTLGRIATRRKELAERQKALRAFADKELANVPGGQPPARVSKPEKGDGGKARAQFVSRWQDCLGTLQRLQDLVSTLPRPAWVNADVHPAFVFDQASEWWYDHHIRRNKEDDDRDTEIESLHQRNAGRGDRAVRDALAEWSEFDGSGGWPWPKWANEHPKRLNLLLQPPALRELNESTLSEIVFLAHAWREHIRQTSDEGMGLRKGMTLEGRCEAFARFLIQAKTAEGNNGIREVLQFALWGAPENDHAARVWSATHTPRWKLPRLGESSLGELIGYARPNDCPPRNDRAVRTLRAWGFDVRVR